jgi:hypothetical protein
LIWHHGISPDVVIHLPPEVTPLLPVTERELTAEKLRESQDIQLLRALDLLFQEKGHGVYHDRLQRFAYDLPSAEVD